MMDEPTSVVTGAAGFLGSHLCERLLDEGHSVVGIDAFTDSYDPALKQSNLDALRGRSRFSLIQGHLAAIDLSPLLDGAAYVFHLAARAGVRGGWGPIFDAYDLDNLRSTQRLLEALRQTPGLKQLVMASTSSVYGRDPPLPTPETAPTRPESYYAITKLACEKLVEAYQLHFHLPITTLRFYTLYGPRQRPDMAFHIFIRALLEDREITIFGDGNQTREVTYVADAVDAVLKSIGPQGAGQTFNVGGGAYKSLNAYLEDIEAIVGRKFRRKFGPTVKGDQLHSRADISKARELLGYSPSFPLRDGIEAEVGWIESQMRR